MSSAMATGGLPSNPTPPTHRSPSEFQDVRSLPRSSCARFPLTITTFIVLGDLLDSVARGCDPKDRWPMQRPSHQVQGERSYNSEDRDWRGVRNRFAEDKRGAGIEQRGDDLGKRGLEKGGENGCGGDCFESGFAELVNPFHRDGRCACFPAGCQEKRILTRSVEFYQMSEPFKSALGAATWASGHWVSCQTIFSRIRICDSGKTGNSVPVGF